MTVPMYWLASINTLTEIFGMGTGNVIFRAALIWHSVVTITNGGSFLYLVNDYNFIIPIHTEFMIIHNLIISNSHCYYMLNDVILDFSNMKLGR